MLISLLLLLLLLLLNSRLFQLLQVLVRSKRDRRETTEIIVLLMIMRSMVCSVGYNVGVKSVNMKKFRTRRKKERKKMPASEFLDQLDFNFEQICILEVGFGL